MMDEKIKHTVDPERWHKRTLMEQLGNIGSEIGRAREVCADTFYNSSREYGDTPEKLEKYFYYFAVAARRSH